MQQLRTEIRQERGQTMVEFALVLPLLALLLFGVIQFGILFNNYVTLTDAARAGARKAVVLREDPDVVNKVVTAVKNSATDLKATDINVSVSSSGGWQPGTDVTVAADYPYSINLLGLIVKSGRFHTSTTERLE